MQRLALICFVIVSLTSSALSCHRRRFGDHGGGGSGGQDTPVAPNQNFFFLVPSPGTTGNPRTSGGTSENNANTSNLEEKDDTEVEMILQRRRRDDHHQANEDKTTEKLRFSVFGGVKGGAEAESHSLKNERHSGFVASKTAGGKISTKTFSGSGEAGLSGHTGSVSTSEHSSEHSASSAAGKYIGGAAHLEGITAGEVDGKQKSNYHNGNLESQKGEEVKISEESGKEVKEGGKLTGNAIEKIKVGHKFGVKNDDSSVSGKDGNEHEVKKGEFGPAAGLGAKYKEGLGAEESFGARFKGDSNVNGEATEEKPASFSGKDGTSKYASSVYNSKQVGGAAHLEGITAGEVDGKQKSNYHNGDLESQKGEEVKISEESGKEVKEGGKLTGNAIGQFKAGHGFGVKNGASSVSGKEPAVGLGTKSKARIGAKREKGAQFFVGGGGGISVHSKTK